METCNKSMSEKGRYRTTYAWLWIRSLIVTVVMGWLFCGGWIGPNLLEFLDAAMATNFHHAWTELDSWEVNVVTSVLFGLLWWRMVKVFVLHGSPFTNGMKVVPGREDNEGASGRLVTLSYIGDWDVYGTDNKVEEHGFWMGAIFRAHSTSDKLIRSRLEFLILALPRGCSLVISESRVFLQKTGHIGRAERFRMWTDKYMSAKKMELMPEDKFRREIVENMKDINRHLQSG